MKRLATAIMLMTSACLSQAASLGPFVVGGSGSNCEAAKKVAFVRAIEYAVGSSIITEKQSVNDNLTRDDLLTHSAGFIRDNYEILSSIQNGSNCEVKVRVYVDPSMINDHILHTAKDSKNINGNKVGERVQSYMDMQNSGDALLNNVLKDYPYKAYDLKQGHMNVQVDYTRNVSLRIPFTVTMNQKYLEALQGVLGQVKDKECSMFCGSDPSVDVNGKVFYFNDIGKPRQVFNTFEPFVIRVTLKDAMDNTLRNYCVDTSTKLAPMVTTGSAVIIRGGHWKLEDAAIIDVTSFQNRMKDVDHVDMKIVKVGGCR